MGGVMDITNKGLGIEDDGNNTNRKCSDGGNAYKAGEKKAYEDAIKALLDCVGYILYGSCNTLGSEGVKWQGKIQEIRDALMAYGGK